MAKEPVYWLSPLDELDDFGQPFGDIMYDGKTRQGPWANMSEVSWKMFGAGRLGTGYGQKYRKQSDGRWLKIEG